MTNEEPLPRDSRLVIATLAAPVAGCVVGAVLWGLGYMVFTGESGAGSILLLPFMGFAYGVSIGMIASLVVGLPVHVLLVRMRLTSVWAYLACGAVSGAPMAFLVMLAVSGSSPPENSNEVVVGATPLGAFLGFWVAAFFWLIRRPDRDPPNPPTSAS